MLNVYLDHRDDIPEMVTMVDIASYVVVWIEKNSGKKFARENEPTENAIPVVAYRANVLDEDTDVIDVEDGNSAKLQQQDLTSQSDWIGIHLNPLLI